MLSKNIESILKHMTSTVETETCGEVTENSAESNGAIVEELKRLRDDIHSLRSEIDILKNNNEECGDNGDNQSECVPDC